MSIQVGAEKWDGRQLAKMAMDQEGRTPDEIADRLSENKSSEDADRQLEAQAQFQRDLAEQRQVVEDEEIARQERDAEQQRRMMEAMAAQQIHHEGEQAQLERWREEQEANSPEARAEREANNAQTNSIAMGPLNVCMAAASIHLMGGASEVAGGMMTPDTLAEVGQQLGPHVNGLGDTMMVTGDGSQLASARNAMEVGAPAADLRVTGPEQTMSFQPGQTPEPGQGLTQNGPGLSGPQQVPGMNGPGGMG